MAVFELERSPGLPPDVESGHGRSAARSALHHQAHQIAHGCARFGRDDPFARNLSAISREKKGGLDPYAAIDDRRHRRCKKEGRHGYAMAIGDRNFVCRPPDMRKEGPRRCSCFGFDPREKTERLKKALLQRTPGCKCNAGGARIRRADENLFYRHRLALGVHIAQQEVDKEKWPRVEDFEAGGDTAVQGHRYGESLENGSEFVEVRHHAVLPVLARRLLAPVRIEIRERDRSQNFAIFHIEDNAEACNRSIAVKSLRQLFAKSVLHGQIESEPYGWPIG